MAAVRQFRRLKEDLEDTFGDDVDITSESTPQVTGWFEVDVNGKLLHSKKNGDGYVDSIAKIDKIKEGIKEALR